MATVTKKTKLKASQKSRSVSVSITPRLQAVFVGFVTVTFLAISGPAVYYSFAYPSPGNLTQWVQLLTLLLPLALFGFTLWYVGNLGSKLARIFKAVFLAVIGLLLFGTMQMIAAYLPFLQPQYAGDWQSRYAWQQIIITTLTFAAFAGSLLAMRWRRKGKRG